MGCVLVVDPDPATRRFALAALRYGRLDSETVDSIDAAGRRMRRGDVLALLVDPGDGRAGTNVSELRDRSDVPIIVLTPEPSRRHAIECLDAGADDYVAVPFDAEELLARLRAVLRRAVQSGPDPVYTTADFTIDVGSHRVRRANGLEVRLTPIEWNIVELLTRHPDHLVGRDELLTAIWGRHAVDKPEYLRVHLANLRRKLEPDPTHPRYFVTAPGLGLRFVSGVVATPS